MNKIEDIDWDGCKQQIFLNIKNNNVQKIQFFMTKLVYINTN